jgi:hypothetical protein
LRWCDGHSKLMNDPGEHSLLLGCWSSLTSESMGIFGYLDAFLGWLSLWGYFG